MSSESGAGDGQPSQAFDGRIGRTVHDSVPWWPARPDRGSRPNVVAILLDDVGFAQFGCYGSSIRTPNIDALAGRGIRYSNFHVAALCSPTRASLLSGRNHHSVGMGFLAAFDTGFPSYRADISPAAALFPEVLRDSGYGTYACGKWHLTPPGQMSPAGPFRSWPTQRGFDRYYGFLWGEDDQYRPELWYDQHRVEVPDRPGYHVSEDLVGRSQEFLSDHLTARPDDPFLLYLAFGACHAPHQAPAEFIDAYRGAFDHGWDVERERTLTRQVQMGIVPAGTSLAPRNPGVRAWDSLDVDEQRLFARMQEVYAGFLTHTDAQIGALVDFLDRNGVLDNTIILLLSDNGASGEGGEHGTANEYRWFLQLPDPLIDSLAAYEDLGTARAHNHYPTGWAQAGNTPFKFYKRFAYAGGVRAPLIVHWPAGIAPDPEPRGQFHHVIDIAPTVLDLCGAALPESYRGVPQLPMHGTSMRYSFATPTAPSTRTLQYFETAGYRGIYADGYKAIAAHAPGQDFASDRWELYRMTDDVSECHDLSPDQPELAQRLSQLWWEQAEAYGVLPLDDRMQTRMAANNPGANRNRYRMLPGTRLMHGTVGPTFAARQFRIRARLHDRVSTDEGVLLCWGRRAAGFSLFVQHDALVLDYNLAGEHTVIASPSGLPTGTVTLELVVDRDGHTVDTATDAARATLLANGETLVQERLPRLVPRGMGTLSSQCGLNSPSAISERYQAPFRYSGVLRDVVIDLEPTDGEPTHADWLAALASQ
ncbi:MAG TPA: arylsulfatase [Nakamurella sp.]|nr:arylsulfatase [Nakamurella sp.]